FYGLGPYASLLSFPTRRSSDLDSTDPDVIYLVDEDSAVNEEALGGRGSRPSPFFIERIATEAGFEVERHFTADLNAGEYVYDWRSEEHTSELQSRENIVCRLLL